MHTRFVKIVERLWIIALVPGIAFFLTACAQGGQSSAAFTQLPSTAVVAPLPAPTGTGASLSGSPGVANYKDATFEIEGRSIALVNGVSEIEAAPGSASKIVTRFFGNEGTGDLNGDGTPDVAFLLAQTGGGSGTFFYVVAALKTKDGYVGTNGVLLGDRIAPQSTQLRDGTITVNYADRKPGEPMTTAPSVGMSKYLKVVGAKLVPVPN